MLDEVYDNSEFTPIKLEIAQRFYVVNSPDDQRIKDGVPYNGLIKTVYDTGAFEIENIINGLMHGMRRCFSADGNLTDIMCYNAEYMGSYFLKYDKNGNVRNFVLYDNKDSLVKQIWLDDNNRIRECHSWLEGDKYYSEKCKESDDYQKWQKQRKYYMEKGYYDNDLDLLPYYQQQVAYKHKVVCENQLPPIIKYIAGVDVAYNDIECRMVGGIVVLDANTLEVVEQAVHDMAVTFPYVPGLFSFREVPAVKAAYEKLTIKPDLIVCDGHGIAHPMGVGMATHLGIELDIPTIGCAKKRLVGFYEKEQLGKERGDKLPLVWDSEDVGYALRTQNDTNPVFVSIGHKIDIQTAIDWVLKLTPKYRLPETTRHADHLVNQIMKERLEIDFMQDGE